MATALKLPAEPVTTEHSPYWDTIVETMRPLYDKDAMGEYFTNAREAIVRAVGSVPITDAIRIYNEMHAEANQEPFPYGDESLEDHALYAGREAFIFFIVTGKAKNQREALARVSFVAANVDSEETPFMDAGMIRLAIKSMGKDISQLAKRSLAEKIGADADAAGQVFLSLADPAFNPLRDIAVRLKYLDDNEFELTQAGGDAGEIGNDLSAKIYDEREALFTQASFLTPYTADDALTLLGAIEFAVRPLIDHAESEVENGPAKYSYANQFKLDMANSILRGVYRMADWLEITHAIERQSLAGTDFIPHYLNPFTKKARGAKAA